MAKSVWRLVTTADDFGPTLDKSGRFFACRSDILATLLDLAEDRQMTELTDGHDRPTKLTLVPKEENKTYFEITMTLTKTSDGVGELTRSICSGYFEKINCEYVCR